MANVVQVAKDLSPLCKYFDFKSLSQYKIGFSESEITFIIFPLLSITVNIIIIIFYFKRLRYLKGQESLEKMLFFLTFVETLISFYWLISALFFYNTTKILENCEFAYGLAIGYTFLHVLDMSILFCTIHNLKTIVFDPVDGIQVSKKRVYKYLAACIVFAAIVCVIGYTGDIYGLSPKLTCYITNNVYILETNFKIMTYYSVLCILILIILTCFFYMGRLLYFNYYHPNRVLKQLLVKYLGFSLIYSIFYLPQMILHFVTLRSNKDFQTEHFMDFIYFCSVLNVSVDLALGLFRLFVFNYSPLNFAETGQGIKESLLEVGAENGFIEKLITLNIIENLFIGLCHVTKKSCDSNSMKWWNSSINTHLDTVKSDIDSETLYEINNSNIGFEDEMIKSKEISIEFYEIAPLAFKEIRKVEGVNEIEMLKSFKPSNNSGIFENSKGKSGSVFISTDDEKYILKSMKYEEVEVMTSSFLLKYVKYIHDHNESLLCRIYGIYKMKAGETYYYFVLMRNLIGMIRSQNILGIYDLKGCSIGREVKLQDESEARFITQKDVNFEKNLERFNVSYSDAQELRRIIKNDTKFLEKQELMDYSLLFVKVLLTDYELNSLNRMSMFKNSAIVIQSINEESKEVPSTAAKTSFFPEVIKTNPKLTDFNQYKKHIFKSTSNSNVIYIIAIIDYLQLYNFRKYLETAYKSNFLTGYHHGTFSSVPPNKYSRRFYDFIKRYLPKENNSDFITDSEMGKAAVHVG